jgi:hypothetical protein
MITIVILLTVAFIICHNNNYLIDFTFFFFYQMGLNEIKQLFVLIIIFIRFHIELHS